MNLGVLRVIKFKIGHTYKNLFSEQFSPLTVVKRVPIPRAGEVYIYYSDDEPPWRARCEDIEIINTPWGEVYRADEELENER